MHDLSSHLSDNAVDKVQPSDESLWEELSGAFLYEVRQQLRGLAQTVAQGDLLPEEPEPAQSQTVAGRHMQMFGRAAADMIPIVVTGIAVRSGFGKALPAAVEPGLLMRRSVIGLSAVESGTTGLLTGALLRPTDQEQSSSISGLLTDRARSGVSGAFSFAALTGLNAVAEKIANKAWSPIAAVLQNPIGNGLVTGAPAGLVNAQIESFVQTGSFTSDRTLLEKSVYEMTMVGGAFGAFSAVARGGFKAAHAGSAPEEKPAESPGAQAAAPVSALSERGAQPSSPADAPALPEGHLVSGSWFPSKTKFPADDVSLMVMLDPSGSMSAGHGSESLPATAKHTPASELMHEAIDEMEQYSKAGHAMLMHESLHKAVAAHQKIIEKLSKEDFVVVGDIGSPSKQYISAVDAIAKHNLYFSNNGNGTLLHPGYKHKLADMCLPEPADYQQSLNRLKEQFGADSFEVKALSHLPYKQLVADISRYIDESPEVRKPIISELIEKKERIDVDTLRGFEALAQRFGNDSPVYLFLKEHEGGFYSDEIADLAKFIEEKPESRARELKELISKGPYFEEVRPGMLRSMEVLRENLGAASPAMEKITQYKDAWINDLRREEMLETSDKLEVPHTIPHVFFLDEFEVGGTGKTFNLNHGNESPGSEHLSSNYLDDDALQELADFVLEDPAKHAEVLRRQLLNGDSPEELDSERLSALATIHSVFGADSPTAEKIRQLESDNFFELSEFGGLLKKRPESASVLERLVQNGALPAEFSVDRVQALTGLEAALGGAGSAQMTRLMELEQAGLSLPKLDDFISQRSPEEGSLVSWHAMWEDLMLEKLKALVQENGETKPAEAKADADPARVKRVALVERLINDGAGVAELKTSRLESLLVLEQRLESYPQVLQTLLGFEKNNNVELKQFSQLFRDDEGSVMLAWPDASDPSGSLRPDFLKTVLESTQDPARITRRQLLPLQQFIDASKGSNIDLVKLLELQSQNLDLKGLAQFIDGKNQKDEVNAAGAAAPSQASEPAVSSLDTGEGSSNGGGVNPRKILVEQLIEQGEAIHKITPKRLAAIETLYERFGADSSTMAGLLKVESDICPLDKLAKFITKAPAENGELVKRLVAENASAEQLAPARLEALAQLERTLGQDDPYLKKLLEREAEGISLSQIAIFLDEPKSKKSVFDVLLPGASELEKAKQSGQNAAKSILQQLLDENAGPDKLTFNYLTARFKLNGYLGDDSPTMKRVLELGEQGLDLRKLQEFIDENQDEHKSLVQRLVDSGATVNELSYSRLRGLSILTNRLEPDRESFDHLLALEKQGLSLADLARYISEDLSARGPQVKELLANRASIKELNVKRLADAAVLGKLGKHFGDDKAAIKYITDLQVSGLSANRLMRFIEEEPAERKLLVQQLISEGADLHRFNNQMTLSLFPDDVAYRILDTAKQEGRGIASLLGALKDWKTGEKFHQTAIEHVRGGGPASVEALNELNQQIKDGTLEVETAPRSITDASARQRTERGAEVASILQQALDGIEKSIPLEQPIVLLGRDNWQLLPLLRDKGRPVQYFLWSRLQGADLPTREQWLKEVPPNAAVIDTGYSGSIINWIRSIDPSASGYLLSSSGRYPQLLPGYGSGKVQKIEYFPKLIGRAKTYTENGGAVSKNKTRDGDEEKGKKDLNHRWFVQGANVDLLRAAGLPPWSVWRFSDYVGLTPQERLGLNTRQEVRQHYLRVEEARLKASQESAAKH